MKTGGASKKKSSSTKKPSKKITKKSPSKKSSSKKMKGGMEKIPKVNDGPVTKVQNTLDGAVTKFSNFLATLDEDYLKSVSYFKNLKIGNQRLIKGGLKKDKKDKKDKKTKVKKTKKIKGGFDGSDLSTTASSGGPANAPDSYWGADGEKWFRQFNKTGGLKKDKKDKKHKKDKKDKKGKKTKVKKTKKIKGGFDGSDWSTTASSRGPANAPDSYWGVDGEKWFRQFNKTGEYIPNSQLKYAATPELSGKNESGIVTGYDESIINGGVSNNI
jgi:hypothetical protein